MANLELLVILNEVVRFIMIAGHRCLRIGVVAIQCGYDRPPVGRAALSSARCREDYERTRREPNRQPGALASTQS